jgi:uncharacterized damage-inducible protein DinB
VSDAVRQALVQHSADLVAASESMPADKYDYRPTEGQMTFGALVVHIVQTNSAICSAIGGIPPPDVWKFAPTESKDVLLAALRNSFTFCGDALARVSDARLGEEVSMGGRRTGMSRASAMITIASDWADHYSTAASYLRLNGILPPSASPRK